MQDSHSPPGSSSPQPSEIQVEFEIAAGERVLVQVDAQSGAQVQQLVRRAGSQNVETPAAQAGVKWLTRLDLAASRWLVNEKRLGILAGLLALGLFLAGLESFPVGFSSREAVSTVIAGRLVENGFQVDGEVLPAFFNTGSPNLFGASVYLQLFASALAQQSVWAARLTGVVAGWVGLLWVGLILRRFYNLSHPTGWLMAVLAGAMTPVWFVFSRSAHPEILTATLYAGFWYYYLLYRAGKPRALYAALSLAGVACYATTAGRILVPLTLLCLGVADWRLHRAHRWLVIGVLGVAAMFGFPLVRWLLNHPGAAADTFLAGSYLRESVGLGFQFQSIARNLIGAFSPAYWFFPNPPDGLIYRLAGHAHISFVLLPLALIGLWRSLGPAAFSSQRLILIWLLGGAVSSALLGRNINHLLPLALGWLLMSGVGMDWLVQWLGGKLPRAVNSLRIGALLMFGLSSVIFGLVTLSRQPARLGDYGRDGAQYGAQRVFKIVQQTLRTQPEMKVWISPEWVEQPDVLARFFLSQAEMQALQVGGMDSFLKDIRPDIEQILFVQNANEFRTAQASGMFLNPEVLGRVDLPDGQAGIYLAAYRYAEDAGAVLQALAEQNRRLVSASIFLDGQSVEMRHSVLDMGSVKDLFDGDPNTLIRSKFANPLVIELVFPLERRVSGVRARVGAEPVRMSIKVVDAAGIEQGLSAEEGRVADYKTIQLLFSQPLSVNQMRIEVLDIEVGEPSNVHLWDLEILP